MVNLGIINKDNKIPWRILNTGYNSAATNMGMDEAIMEAYAAGQVPPTIRFYGWKPAAVSLGYFQHGEKEINFAACHEQGIDIVRRLTGGRAVLHNRELTYSIIVGENYPEMPKTITASYRYLSKGLLLGLEELGLTAEMTKPIAAYGQHIRKPASAACFDAPSHYELTIDRRKLIGSAQVRKHGVILQHGSILLDFSPSDLASVLVLSAEEENKTIIMLQNKVADLKTSLGREVSWDEVRIAMTKGLQKSLEISEITGELTIAELKRAEVLAQIKYSSELWTKRR
ncbi:MAG: biotin/lipoate A/B protein ligase family protein [Acidaminococcaceae bacterium]|nr:biotin/lipoate A/B protein ligase family protein [Acidaminococcaceae bacterium]MDD4721284.1 biotin/lipoate A/B protein ligase family protein [Acidaminococcaceae bacterium]